VNVKVEVLPDIGIIALVLFFHLIQRHFHKKINIQY